MKPCSFFILFGNREMSSKVDNWDERKREEEKWILDARSVWARDCEHDIKSNFLDCFQKSIVSWKLESNKSSTQLYSSIADFKFNIQYYSLSEINAVQGTSRELFHDNGVNLKGYTNTTKY